MNISQIPLAEILAERARQDARWGGPAHDDRHPPATWLDLIDDQLMAAGMEGDETTTAAVIRARLVKVAALAIAGIQSLDRAGARARP